MLVHACSRFQDRAAEKVHGSNLACTCAMTEHGRAAHGTGQPALAARTMVARAEVQGLSHAARAEDADELVEVAVLRAHRSIQ